MSVSLLEVLNSAGYDFTKLEDAQWLSAQEAQWDELLEQAEELIDEAEYQANEEAEREYREKFPLEGDEE